MKPQEIQAQWLKWYAAALGYFQDLHPEGLRKDRGGNLIREKIDRAEDGWIKPELGKWFQEDFGTPFTETHRQAFAKQAKAMQAAGLIEVETTDRGRRIAWLRLTTKGLKLAPQVTKKPPRPPLGMEDLDWAEAKLRETIATCNATLAKLPEHFQAPAGEARFLAEHNATKHKDRRQHLQRCIEEAQAKLPLVAEGKQRIMRREDPSAVVNATLTKVFPSPKK
jgi:DNA-binding MarR family transcriptional regulator